MKKVYFNNLISFAIILSIVTTPFFYAERARATTLNTGSSVGVGSLVGGVGGKAAGMISGMLPAIATLPGCKDIIQNKIQSLFSKTTSQPKTLTTAKEAASAESNYVNVIMPSYINDTLQETKDNTTETRKNIEQTNSNKICLDSIGKMVAKKLLQEITLSTVEWIKSGNGGAPFFVQDPGKFFGDIAKNEILTFSGEISDPTRYPFGKAFMQNVARDVNQKFQDNARYSLNETIAKTNPQYSSATFQKDFSQGGWSAWEAMTQVPANNPLGFQIMASEELGKRLEGTSQSPAQEVRSALTQAGGFLGDQKCVDPKTGRLNGITKEEDLAGRKDRATSHTAPYQNRICEKWEYVTPGKTIADMTTKAIGYPDKGLIDAETLNDAIAAVLDAALARFSNELTQKGLANMTTDSSNYSQYDQNSTYNNPSKVTSDFPQYQIAASTWLAQNPYFNIRTDLDQALIDTQRTYSDKLETQTIELKNLMSVIYQLDYCIPGPHPGWEDDSREVIKAAMDKVIPETEESLSNLDGEAITGLATTVVQTGAVAGGAALGATIGSAVPVLGTIIGAVAGVIVGAIVGLISGIFSSDDYGKVRMYYGTILAGFTGLHVDYEDSDNPFSLNIQSKEGLEQTMNKLFDRYTEIVNNIYFPKDITQSFLPTVAKEAANKFNDLTSYKGMIEANEDKINAMKGVINRLIKMKEQVDILNTSLANESIDQSTYENKLGPIISEFGRLSSEMVSGDDVASVDTISKQTTDEKNYVYNQLLKGPFGCEKQLEEGNGTKNIPWPIITLKRPAYPVKLLYDYNTIPAGGLIPDVSGYPVYKNHMWWQYVNTSTPGILGEFQTFVWDDTTNGECFVHDPYLTLAQVPYRVACEIRVDVPLEKWGSTVSLFEKMLRIY